MQSEKLIILERQSEELSNVLRTAESECSEAKARALVAENIQDSLRDQLTAQKRDAAASSNALPTSLVEQVNYVFFKRFN